MSTQSGNTMISRLVFLARSLLSLFLNDTERTNEQTSKQTTQAFITLAALTKRRQERERQRETDILSLHTQRDDKRERNKQTKSTHKETTRERNKQTKSKQEAFITLTVHTTSFKRDERETVREKGQGPEQNERRNLPPDSSLSALGLVVGAMPSLTQFDKERNWSSSVRSLHIPSPSHKLA